MPKFAYFNAAANPAPVLGWYDTDIGEWPNLPGSDYLIEVSAADWAIRDSQAWQVHHRQLEPVPGITLAQAQAAQLALIGAAYDAAYQLPVSYMSTTFQADTGSQDVLSKTLAALTPIGAAPAGFYWADANNMQVPMTLVQLQGLAAAMMSQGWAAFQHKQTQKAAIRAAITVAAVQLITW
ncbi:MAG: DUF4376 domain-containing protein [Sulfuriferula sp.]